MTNKDKRMVYMYESLTRSIDEPYEKKSLWWYDNIRMPDRNQKLVTLVANAKQIDSIKQNPKGLTLNRLIPAIYKNAILCMTRTCEALNIVATNTRILPFHHHTTISAIKHCHASCHNQKRKTIINGLRRLYPTAQCRAYAKIKCNQLYRKSLSAVTEPQQMALLPVTHHAAPTYLRADCYGLIHVLVLQRTKERWINFPIVRAVHTELSSFLDSILAIRNIIPRSSKLAVFYCNRRTNFIDANRDLNEAMVIVNRNRFMFKFASLETTILIDEAPSLMTHPLLTCMSDVFEASTFHDNSVTSKRWCWQTSQRTGNKFCKQWTRNLLGEITRRSKSGYSVKPIQVGDVVVIIDPAHTWH